MKILKVKTVGVGYDGTIFYVDALEAYRMDRMPTVEEMDNWIVKGEFPDDAEEASELEDIKAEQEDEDDYS